METDASFGAWLQSRRRALGLTQGELAELVGYSISVIRKIEQEERRPSHELAELLTQHLLIPHEQRDCFVRVARGELSVDILPSPNQYAGLVHEAIRRQGGTNLPTPLTGLIGRTQEIAAVRSILQDPDVHLLTLSGPPGIGKTRLALAVAAELHNEFADGVHFVALAPIRDTELVLPTIARTLGVKETGEKQLLEMLRSYLYDQQLLLILDNFEHVLSAAPHVAELLTAPRMKVLVTSRGKLHLYGEHEFAVPPLPTPNLLDLPPLKNLHDYAAVSLFHARARAIQRDFSITSANIQAVVEICIRLDGLPLAIELAAVRTKLLPPSELLNRLNRRLVFLSVGSSNLPPRQQSLRAAIDWSFELLTSFEQALFCRLAAFANSCTLEAAIIVCRIEDESSLDVETAVESLLNNSLLQQAMQADGKLRLTMLETIREYALERLEQQSEADSVRRQHAAHYLTLAELADKQLQGADQRFWVTQLQAEHDNLRAALSWAEASQETEVALRIGTALWWFWYIHGHLSEGRWWLEQSLAGRGKVDVSVRAKALSAAGGLACAQSDYRQATIYYEESLAFFESSGDQINIAVALNNLGVTKVEQGDFLSAISYYERSLALYREVGDRAGIASCLNNLGVAAAEQGDFMAASSYYEESLKLVRLLQDQQAVARTLNNLGYALSHQDNHDYAQEVLKEGLELFNQFGDSLGSANTLSNLGWIAYQNANYNMAITYYKKSLAFFQERKDPRGIAECLERLGCTAAALEQSEYAARLWGAAETLREQLGAPMPLCDRALYEQTVSMVRQQIGITVFESARDAGYFAPPEQVIAIALRWEPERTSGSC